MGMNIMENSVNQVQSAVKAMAAGFTRNQEKKESEFWVNVGFYVQHPETGEEVFISLPLGIPLDSLEPEKVLRPDSTYGKMVLAKNAFLKDMQETAKSLAKGDTKRLPNLCVEIRRRGESTTEDTDIQNNFFYRKVV